MSELGNPDLLIDEWLAAAGRGDAALVVDYLNRRIQVNALNETNTTALMMAVKGGHVELVRVLLDHGANPSREDSLGYTAMTYAIIGSQDWATWIYERQIPQPDPRLLELLLAAGGRYGFREAVLLNDVALARARLDEDTGADVNAGRGTYAGPLLKIAAELGYLEIVELLLDRGADIEAMDGLGYRALVGAAQRGHTEVVRRLLERGADINACETTALMMAVRGGHVDTIRVLLDHGADLRPENGLDYTAMTYAILGSRTWEGRMMNRSSITRSWFHSILHEARALSVSQ